MNNNPVYSSDKSSWVDNSIKESPLKENPAITRAEELFKKEIPTHLEHTVHVNKSNTSK